MKEDLIEIPAQVEYPERDGKPMAETQRQVKEMVDLLAMLECRYCDDARVYVAGNMFIYYEEGNPKKRFSPDVYVVKGVSDKKFRRTYRLWEEKLPPSVIFEIKVFA